MIPPVYPRGLAERGDVKIGGTTPEEQYLYRPGELLVHTEDSDLMGDDLGRLGYRCTDRVGSIQLWTGGAADVPAALPSLRTGRSRMPRITAHHAYFPCPGRVGTAGLAVATDRTFPPNLAPVTDDVLIGVVDTGIVERGGNPHPWFGGHVRYGPDDIDPPAETSLLEKFDGHGTFVAGLLLREAPRATVVMKGVSDEGFLSELAIANAIRELGEDDRIELINLSISGYTERQQVPLAIADALRTLDERVVVVIAAGNDGSDQRTYPAGIPRESVAARLIAVGAVDETRTVPVGASPPLAEFSNFGDWVDAYANGVDLLGPFFAGDSLDQRFTGYALWSGTSYATATVTGRIASARLDNPALTSRQAAELVLGQEVLTVGTVGRPYVRGVTSTWPRIEAG
jgi:hypothetical protein